MTKKVLLIDMSSINRRKKLVAKQIINHAEAILLSVDAYNLYERSSIDDKEKFIAGIDNDIGNAIKGLKDCTRILETLQ